MRRQRMQVRTHRGRIWAAWLGLTALVLNALVPVHIAFDLAEAFGGAPLCSAHSEFHNAEWRVLALLSGHRDADGPAHQQGKHHKCPVCSALGTVAGLAPPMAAPLSIPVRDGLPAALSADQAETVAAPAGYHSRAPPVA
jgi:Protein of unknown function (DUF2946)